MHLQPVYDIAELCAQHGVRHAIVCPGSRCAPITMAFARHSNITCRTISDERSAAFIALGIAQQTHAPVALVCTSGSAAYNFAPAIAEAYYQQIPLLVITADRPAEWIDQWDGQTIRQEKIYGNHVKQSFNLPHDHDHPDSVWHFYRLVNEAISVSQSYPQGPVHLNVPLREPLYPAKDQTITFSKNIKSISTTESELRLSEKTLKTLSDKLASFGKILVVAGQQDFNEETIKAVKYFCNEHQAVLVGDVISNFHSLPNTIRHADSFLGQCTDYVNKTLAPELLITFGKSVISKNLKLFIRKYKPAAHWHIQPTGNTADTFQALTQIIHCNPQHFFESTSVKRKSNTSAEQMKATFVSLWKAEEQRTSRSIKTFFSETTFSEFAVIKEVLDSLPARCNLHLANSMTVRYANLVGLTQKHKGVHVYSNRGTSGIDGCTSTVAGHTLVSNVPNVLITGDMAFFYDRNAFWHNYSLPNMHVVVINNQGGVIFNLIDGPGNIEEKDQYFVTQQKLSAANLAQEFGFEYLKIDSARRIKNTLQNFFEFEGKTKIMEVLSNQKKSKETFEKFKNAIKKNYEA